MDSQKFQEEQMQRGAIAIFKHAADVLHSEVQSGYKKMLEDGHLNKESGIMREGSQLNKDTRIMLAQSIPSIILLSFSIELAFKTIICQTGDKPKKEHGLKNLLSSLDVDKQQKIKNDIQTNLDIDDATFEEFLKQNNKIFVEWRYFYQMNPEPANVVFLNELFESLKNLIDWS